MQEPPSTSLKVFAVDIINDHVWTYQDNQSKFHLLVDLTDQLDIFGIYRFVQVKKYLGVTTYINGRVPASQLVHELAPPPIVLVTEIQWIIALSDLPSGFYEEVSRNFYLP